MMATLKNKNNLVWVDLEMTGLDPDKEKIIEIATIVTDNQLHILAEGPNLVIHQPLKLLRKMDDWNKTQHGKSGLLELVKNSKISVKQAERQTLEFLKPYCFEGKAPLCGNSIDQDRRFLIKTMPKLNKFLHYRNVDVSTIKALVARWYRKNKNLPKKNEGHRALDDVRESLEELRFYRKTYFKRGLKKKSEKAVQAS